MVKLQLPEGAPSEIRSRIGNSMKRVVIWIRSQDGVVRAAWVLGVIQFLLLAIEEIRIASAGALSYDYSVDAGAYGAIAHGNFDPNFLVALRLPPFLYNHYDVLTWPLALLLVGLLRLPVTWTLLILLQALPLALIGPIVATYASIRAREAGLEGVVRKLVVIAPAILAFADIWLYWSAEFDYHPKALQGLFVVIAAIALERRWPGWLAAFVVLLLMTGDTGGLVIIGLGLAALLRRRWRPAALMLVVGTLVALAPGSLLPPDAWGGVPALYGTLAPGQHTTLGIAVGVLLHPGPALGRLGRRLPDVWALLGAAGLIGALTPEGVGIMATVGMAAWLAPTVFSFAGLFQTVPVSDVVLLGSVGALIWVATHRRQLVLVVVATGVTAWTVGWGLVFAPRLVSDVRAIAPAGPTGASLASLEAHLPNNQEFVVPNGTIGDFAARHQLLQFLPCGSAGVVRTFGRPVNFVIAPWTGVESCAPGTLLGVTSELAQLPGASLKVLPGPVYWVHWIPGPGSQDLRVNPSVGAVCPALLVRARGVANTNALLHGCGIARRHPGFAVQGYTVTLPPHSRGEAVVALSVQGSASIQVWDDPAGRLVAQRYVGTAPGTEVVSIPFRTPGLVAPSRSFSDGVFPFITRFVPPNPEDAFELRVYAGVGSTVAVTGVWLGQSRLAPQVLRSGAFAGLPGVS